MTPPNEKPVAPVPVGDAAVKNVVEELKQIISIKNPSTLFSWERDSISEATSALESLARELKTANLFKDTWESALPNIEALQSDLLASRADADALAGALEEIIDAALDTTASGVPAAHLDSAIETAQKALAARVRPAGTEGNL